MLQIFSSYNQILCKYLLIKTRPAAEGSLNLSFHFVSKGHILIAASIYLNFRSTGRCFRQIEINFGQITQIILKLKSRERESGIFSNIFGSPSILRIELIKISSYSFDFFHLWSGAAVRLTLEISILVSKNSLCVSNFSSTRPYSLYNSFVETLKCWEVSHRLTTQLRRWRRTIFCSQSRF